MNGCIWDQVAGVNINKVHRGAIDLKDLRTRIAMNIHGQIPLIETGLQKFLALRDKKVEKGVLLSNVFALVAKENSMTFGLSGQAAKMAEVFAEHEAANANLFGVVNTITRVGQLYSPAEWVRFDEIAGKYMNYSDSQWEAFQTRAKGLDTKEVKEKIYGVIAA
jgi:hypothetical protein